MRPMHEATSALLTLRRELDAEIANLAGRLPELRCAKGCRACCIDDLTVFQIEAELIRERHPELLLHGSPGEPGSCAFLSPRGECRIYAERPYVCRTQGLPLRWYEETEEGDILEERATCEKNLEHAAVPDPIHPPLQLATLPESDLWLIGPYEERLAEIQGQLDGQHYQRVPLRSLFDKPA